MSEWCALGVQSALRPWNGDDDDDDDDVRPQLSAGGNRTPDPEAAGERDAQRELLEEFAASVASLLVVYENIDGEREKVDGALASRSFRVCMLLFPLECAVPRAGGRVLPPDDKGRGRGGPARYWQPH